VNNSFVSRIDASGAKKRAECGEAITQQSRKWTSYCYV